MCISELQWGPLCPGGLKRTEKFNVWVVCVGWRSKIMRFRVRISGASGVHAQFEVLVAWDAALLYGMCKYLYTPC